jgi:catechol 2,3-dioxygenase-like lactoylglutathione lyase family enzyme
LINGLSHTAIWVLDQDEALAFYTGKLGFEVSA